MLANYWIKLAADSPRNLAGCNPTGTLPNRSSLFHPPTPSTKSHPIPISQTHKLPHSFFSFQSRKSIIHPSIFHSPPKTIHNKHFKDGFSIKINCQHCPLPHGNDDDDIYRTSTNVQSPQTLSKHNRQRTKGIRKAGAATEAQGGKLEKVTGRLSHAAARIRVRHVPTFGTQR